MRAPILGAVGLFLATMFGPPPAPACGDKNVDVTRGLRAQRVCAAQSADVLVYLGGQTDTKALQRLKSTLARVCHEVEEATSLDSLDLHLRGKTYDVVIVPIEKVAAVSALLRSTGSPSLLIPVMADPGSQPSGVTQEYPFVLSAPGRARDQIQTIHDAMRSRSQADASADP